MDRPPHFNNDTQQIPFADNTKFLGIYINEFLDWSHHIEFLTKKLGSICFGFRATCKYLNEKTLKIMYFANFQLFVPYRIIFWGAQSQSQSIFVIQKRLIRIIKNMSALESCLKI